MAPDLQQDLQQHAERAVGLRFAGADTEQAYRRFFLDQDKRQAMIAIALYTVLKASFGAIDLLVHTPDQAGLLLATRFGFVLVSLLALVAVGRVREPRHYDALVFAWTLLAVASTFYTISHRPPNHFGFLSTSPVLILLFYGFFRNRFELQLFAAGLLTATDLATVFLLRDPQPVTTLIQVCSTYALVNIVGIVVSLQLKKSRRGHFATLQREHELTATMRELAYRDELTGVLNRRSFLLQAGARWQRDACVLMLDLDHFKRLNDRHGHDAGDQALLRFAQLVESIRGEHDVFGRVGGEEFALLLPTATRAQAQALAERIVARCRELAVAAEAGGLSVSVGIATVDAGDADLAATLRRADQALYEAKQGGRGRAVLATPAAQPA